MQLDYVGASPIRPHDDDDDDDAVIPQTVKVSKIDKSIENTNSQHSPCPYEVMAGNRSPRSVPPDLLLGGWQGRPGGGIWHKFIDLARAPIRPQDDEDDADDDHRRQ